MKSFRLILVLLALGCLLAVNAWAQASPPAKPDEKNLQALTDMMRKDLRMQKQSIVDQAMELEAAQKAQFWAIYDKYQKELNAIWDQRIANIQKYADNYQKMTDTVADELALKMLDIQQQNLALKKKYYPEIKAALGAKVAARFLQTEVMIGHLVELQIGSQIPLIQ
jgi:Spy/CpxP family protein refolding chaperone